MWRCNTTHLLLLLLSLSINDSLLYWHCALVQEVDELCEEWRPEPLAPELTAEEMLPDPPLVQRCGGGGCVRGCACMRACVGVHAYVRACVSACVRACVCVQVVADPLHCALQ
jgi:hypothetical protein